MSHLNLIDQTLGHFHILSELGRGGMGVVYKAHQTNLNRTIALKVLPPELTHDSSYVARFRQEAQSAARLEHAAIIPIYEIGEQNDLHYIAMRYIDGQTLSTVMRDERAMSPQRAAELLSPIASALDYAHQHGVIHRDIKPSNIMMASDGAIYLADFGLARGTSETSGLTRTGMVMGTPEYMSPEQAQGLPSIGPATDIYALGVILYQMVTGKLPFESETPMGMVALRITQPPRPPGDVRPDIAPSVEDVIMRALARKPEARYPSAGEMLAALRHATGVSTPVSGTSLPPYSDATIPMQHTPLPSSRPPSYPPSQPPLPPSLPPAEAKKGKSGLLLGLGGAAVLILLLAVGAFFVLRGRNSHPIGGNGGTGNGGGQGGTSPVLETTPVPNDEVATLMQTGTDAMARKGGMDDALKAFDEVLQREPDNAVVLSQIALIHNLRDRYAEGEEAARKAIEKDPKSAFAHAMLAYSLGFQNEYGEALEAANKATVLDENLSSGFAARALVEAYKAEEDYDRNLMGRALEDADKAVELAADEDNLARAITHNVRGEVYWQKYSLTKDHTLITQGIEEENKAIGLQDQVALFYSNLGYNYNAQGNREKKGNPERANELFEQARQKFEQAIAVDSGYAHAHTGLGWYYYYTEKYDQALESFDRALSINPNDTDAYVGKNWVYQDQDPPDYEQAIAAITQAIEVAPNDPSYYTSMGWVYQAQARSYDAGSDERTQSYTQAESWFRKALEVNKNYGDALSGLGWVFFDQSRYDEAIVQFKAALAIKEDQEGVHNGLGWSLYYLERYEEAETAFRRATEIDTEYADAYAGIGWTTYKKANDADTYAEAEQAFRRATELAPERYDYFLGLAYALEALGRTDDAKAAYEKVLELDPTNENAQQGLERLP